MSRQHEDVIENIEERLKVAQEHARFAFQQAWLAYYQAEELAKEIKRVK